MKATFCSCFLLSLLIIVVEARRPFPPTHGMSHPGHKAAAGPEKEKEVVSDDMDGGVSKIGSSPPSCEQKCYGCTPCEAVQVPSTSSRRSHLGLQYTNYEPESWKCKCGPSLYTP